ncbi:MAG: cytochrome c [Hyphomicrobiaceae bacterium]|nr:cytochrome c [Hyphomicrobiaceae bacterium]
MIRVLSVVAALAVGATAVYAQSSAIGQRQAAMKAFAGAAKEPGAVLKGEANFDLAKVQGSLAVYQEQATKLKVLFPDDSKSGEETAALAVIWDKKSDFLSRLDKLSGDAKAAAAAIKDEASFKVEWPKVMSNCGGCHKEYRKAKQ